MSLRKRALCTSQAYREIAKTHVGESSELVVAHSLWRSKRSVQAELRSTRSHVRGHYRRNYHVASTPDAFQLRGIGETRRGEARRGDSSRLFSACPRLARVILGGPVRLSHLSYPFWNGFFASLRGERDIEAGNFSDEMSTGNSRAADGWRFYQQHNSRRTIVCIYYSLILYNQVQFERFHNSEWSNAR